MSTSTPASTATGTPASTPAAGSTTAPNRRSALAVLAGVAAGGSLPFAAATAAVGAPGVGGTTAAPAGATTAAPAVPSAPGGKLPMVADPGDPWHFAAHPSGALTTRVLPGTPACLEVSDEGGVLAVLTTGAKTVTVRGPKRWFTEQKKPFTDRFHRTPAAGWGVSPGGGTWSSHNGVAANYFLEAGRAVIALTDDDASRHVFLSDRQVGDFDASARFSFDTVPTGAPVSLALSFGVQDVDNHYRARLEVTPAGDVRLALEKELADDTTTLAAAVTVDTGFAAFDHWWVQVEKSGPLIRARAWRDGTDTPEDWRHTVRDPEQRPDRVFDAGALGVRALASKGATVPLEARIYDFVVASADWPDPPVVCHDTWVRVLPEPFDGTWSPALEQRIRAWAGDTSPDALAYASMFRPYAPTVTDPALQGARVLGTSGYSDTDGAGLRYVGADFHEYMGLAWTFPASGESTGVPETKWRGNLDCSGFVRMVYGHHMGIPMVLHKKYNGLNLPRESKRQATSGPGTVVAKGTDAPPSLAALRVGDVVFFDAPTDPADNEATAGVVDHTGIYVGRDQHGKLRFVSSRRTPNGPTMADLGAKSILNGAPTDLYTKSLRVIRRF
ncbi:NlpC/P60 family protein [Streptomyces sp. NPDC002057]|uniref:NlpC/P60 family protein n=1 Tax=Streptomyces sp. NPDC002057 TaxID=3154664 RepID=UPI0033259A2D